MFRSLFSWMLTRDLPRRLYPCLLNRVSILVLLDADPRRGLYGASIIGVTVSILVLLDADPRQHLEGTPCRRTEFRSLFSWMLTRDDVGSAVLLGAT